MTNTSKILRIGVITAAVVGAVSIPATAFAANGTGLGMGTTSGWPMGIHQAGNAEDSAHPSHDRGRGGMQGQRAEEHLAKLAASLNVSVETLKAAILATRTELKDQKPATPNDRKGFEEKYLTTLAAKLNVSVDVLKQAMEANRPERPQARPEGRPERRGPQQHQQALATALGVTPEALKAAMVQAREATKPTTKPVDAAARHAHRDAYIAALAARLNVSVDAVKAALEQGKPAKPGKATKPVAADHRAMLQQGLAQMVANGRITQAQADQILADLDAGKPVGEVLKQFMPQRGGGDHRDGGDDRESGRGKGAGSQGQHGSRGERA